MGLADEGKCGVKMLDKAFLEEKYRRETQRESSPFTHTKANPNILRSSNQVAVRMLLQIFTSKRNHSKTGGRRITVAIVFEEIAHLHCFCILFFQT